MRGVTIRVVAGWLVKRVVLAFLTVGLLLGVTVITVIRTQGSNVSISLFGSHANGWGFSSTTETIPGPTINVNQNDFVTVSLTSTDGLSHEFLLDYNGNGVADPGEPVSSIFSTTTQVSFTASVAGSFTYLCLIHPATMHGTWNTASANTPPTVGTLSAAPTPAIPGQQVTFSATSSDANGDVLSYTLTFGDGSSATGTTPAGGGPISSSHTYATDAVNTAVLTVNDGHGGTASSSAQVTIATSFLRVTTSPAVLGKIIVDGIPRDEWGLNWMKIAPGQHVVSFGNVYGYATPAPLTVTTASGLTTALQGSYVAYGSLRITTSPAVAATISIDNLPRDDWGMWQSMPAGTYAISFGKVAGFDPPASQTITLASGQSLTVTGTYTPDSAATGPDPSTYGLLRVTTSPALGSKIVVDGVARDEWGLNWVKVAPGTHTVSFGDVYGYTTPVSQTVTVTAGQTTPVVGGFIQQGSLRILSSPALAATLFVDNVPRDDWGMWQSMPAGSYAVSFGPVPRYTTPTPQTATVTNGALSTITGTYTFAGSPPTFSGAAVRALVESQVELSMGWLILAWRPSLRIP